MSRFSLLALAALPAAACFFMGGGGGGMKDQGITGPTHKAHVGGMVFANERVLPGKENTAVIGDHCTLGQGCYGAFYLAKAMHEYTGRHQMSAASFVLRVSFDGAPPIDAPAWAIMDYQSATGIALIRADSDDGQFASHSRWFLDNFANKLTPGDHTLDISVLGATRTGQATGQPIATGKLTLTAPADASHLVAMVMKHENKIRKQQAAGAASSSASDSSASSASESSSASDSSSASESPASEPAAAAPAKKACLPDGAKTDDWNKCCGGHWAQHTGQNSHRCCSTIGGDCS